MAAQPLGRELNRGERIFNLVRDPTRDFAPRFHPLDLGELAHVLQEQHRAQLAIALAERACGDHQLDLAAARRLQLD